MQQKINIPAELLAQGKPYICTKCGKDIFAQRIKLLKLSKLNPGNQTGRDLVIPQPIWQCVSCKRVVRKGDLEA